MLAILPSTKESIMTKFEFVQLCVLHNDVRYGEEPVPQSYITHLEEVYDSFTPYECIIQEQRLCTAIAKDAKY